MLQWLMRLFLFCSGIGRLLYAVLEHSHYPRTLGGDDERRTVLGLRPEIAPVKCCVLGLTNSKELQAHVGVLQARGDPPTTPLSLRCTLLPTQPTSPQTDRVATRQVMLRSAGVSCRVDDSGVAIGRRYARMDELGVPFAATVDFQTLDDGCVTLRERDTMKQIRVPTGRVSGLLVGLTTFRKVEGTPGTWEEAKSAYPLVGVKLGEL